jgi:hypothetical protein
VSGRAVAERMTGAAVDLLDALDDEQRAAAAWPFPADDERRRWFYTPVDHGGLPLSAMSPRQQQLAMRLLTSGLSVPGYVAAATIVGLENVLDAAEGFASRPGRERGRDPGLYYVRIFGQPHPRESWGWRFGGHHVSVNHTIVNGTVVSSTPCFLGANPASSPLLGPHLLRPLAGAEDLGRELVHSLDEAQLARALLSPVAPADLVTTNRPAVDPAAFEGQEGVPAGDLDADQRGVLRALLDVYVRRIPDDLADAQAARYASEEALDGLSFAWAGSVEPGQPHYYRVQGGTLLAEYDNTQNDANHIHSVWRDLSADFGGDVLAAHYTSHH